MLSPCAAAMPQFVVVELCEYIRIDTVRLSNFEFLSGTFKEFTVSVAKTYGATEAEGWTVVGTYVGKNVRGVQVSTFFCVSVPWDVVAVTPSFFVFAVVPSANVDS
jgi:Sad1 / UNC-like C-terminal